MPQKMLMNLGQVNGRPTMYQMQAFAANQANLNKAPKAPSSLNAPMITRVHNVRGGCNSCGGH